MKPPLLCKICFILWLNWWIYSDISLLIIFFQGSKLIENKTDIDQIYKKYQWCKFRPNIQLLATVISFLVVSLYFLHVIDIGFNKKYVTNFEQQSFRFSCIRFWPSLGSFDYGFIESLMLIPENIKRIGRRGHHEGWYKYIVTSPNGHSTMQKVENSKIFMISCRYRPTILVSVKIF